MTNDAIHPELEKYLDSDDDLVIGTDDGIELEINPKEEDSKEQP